MPAGLVATRAASANSGSAPFPLDVFIVGGQSNACGRGEDEANSPNCTNASIMWTSTATTAWVPLDDPLFVDSTQRGTFCPTFANTYYDLTGVPSAWIMTAGPGTGLLNGDWLPEGTMYDTCVSRYATAMSNLDTDQWLPRLRGMVWLQGENEGINSTEAAINAGYEDALGTMLDGFAGSISPDIELFMVLLGPDNTNLYLDEFAAVRTAQTAFATARSDAHLIYTDTPDFRANDWMLDSVHYKQVGLNDIGLQGGANVAGIVYP